MSDSYQFAKAVDGDTNLADDTRLALLGVCVASQQSAGFGLLIDLREGKCPLCKAPGFNTGWGFFRFTCGAEVLNGEDGGFAEACTAHADHSPDVGKMVKP